MLAHRAPFSHPLHDATAGFKCFRREVIQALPLDRIKSDGYSFQIEMHFHVWKRGLRIVEMPIIFTDRLVGQSKMSRRIVWEAAFLVWKLLVASIRKKIPCPAPSSSSPTTSRA